MSLESFNPTTEQKPGQKKPETSAFSRLVKGLAFLTATSAPQVGDAHTNVAPDALPVLESVTTNIPREKTFDPETTARLDMSAMPTLHMTLEEHEDMGDPKGFKITYVSSLDGYHKYAESKIVNGVEIMTVRPEGVLAYKAFGIALSEPYLLGLDRYPLDQNNPIYGYNSALGSVGMDQNGLADIFIHNKLTTAPMLYRAEDANGNDIVVDINGVKCTLFIKDNNASDGKVTDCVNMFFVPNPPTKKKPSPNPAPDTVFVSVHDTIYLTKEVIKEHIIHQRETVVVQDPVGSQINVQIGFGVGVGGSAQPPHHHKPPVTPRPPLYHGGGEPNNPGYNGGGNGGSNEPGNPGDNGIYNGGGGGRSQINQPTRPPVVPPRTISPLSKKPPSHR